MSGSVGEWSFKEGNTKTVNLGGGKMKKEPGASGVKVKGGQKKGSA